MSDSETLRLLRHDLEPFGLINQGDPAVDEPILTLVHRMHGELEQLRNKVGRLERENTGRAARIKQNEIDIEALNGRLRTHHSSDHNGTDDEQTLALK
jgi:predicted  nucleic acid-binding Zn-ribbon protein